MSAVMASGIADSATNFIHTDQQDINLNNNQTLNSLSHQDYADHTYQQHDLIEPKQESLISEATLFDSGVQYLDLDSCASNYYTQGLLTSHSSSPPSPSGICSVVCGSSINNQYANGCARSPTDYLDHQQQQLSLSLPSNHYNNHQQHHHHGYTAIYTDIVINHHDGEGREHGHGGGIVPSSIIHTNGEDNHSVYVSQEQLARVNNYQHAHNGGDQQRHQQHHQPHQHQQLSTTQAIANSIDIKHHHHHHRHHHNNNNQYHVDSLIHSLNSSSGAIIDGVNNVSIIESSPNNRHHHHTTNDDDYYPHTCRWADCFLSFTDMPEFVKHIEEAHVNSIPEEKHKYYCQWTSCRRTLQSFNARYKLLIHMRVHSGEKPYPCEHESCKKSFSRLENLKIHHRSHTGEKPYCCRYDGCKKAFTNSSDRIKHHKTHLDAKPYACSYNDCDKRYTDPSSLRKHLKIHKKLESDNHKIDSRLNYISVPKTSTSLDDKLSQSWTAGYNKGYQLSNEDNLALSNEYTQCKLANSFTAGCSSSYMTPVELNESGGSIFESSLPNFASLASKSLNSL